MGMMINRRRVCCGEKLPYDAEIEYLESTGTQYINTGYPVNNNVTAKMKIMRLSNINAGTLFGYRFTKVPSAEGNMRFMFLYNDGKIGLRTGVAKDNSAHGLSLNHDYVIEYALNGVKVNNALWISSSQSYQTISFGNGYILNTNTEGYISSDINKFIGRIYYFEERDNDNLVRNLIPVRIGQVGYMYDKVTKQLFGNAGTGSFILGPDK